MSVLVEDARRYDRSRRSPINKVPRIRRRARCAFSLSKKERVPRGAVLRPPSTLLIVSGQRHGARVSIVSTPANFAGSTFYAGVANFLVETRFPEPLAPLEPGGKRVIAFIVLRNSVPGRFCRLVYIRVPYARGKGGGAPSPFVP